MGYSAQKIVSMYRTVFLNSFLLSTLLLAAGCNAKRTVNQLPFYNTADFTPLFEADKPGVALEDIHTIAPFSFTDQNGRRISEKTIDEKIHVANFIFTRCGSICPVMTKHLKMVEKAFGSDEEIVLLSYSVTPWIDSVQRLKEYADHNNITAPNWHFLTGNKNEIYTLARQSYFAEEELGFTKDSTEFLHTEHMLLVDKKRRIRGIYNGTLQLEIEQLIADIKTLKDENTGQH